MKAIIQRVKEAKVTVGEVTVGEIKNGLLVLLGITGSDSLEDDGGWMLKKLTTLRLWPGENDKPWAKSVIDLDFEILVVSQFTLYAKINKGSKPDFHNAMKSEDSRPFFDSFVELLRKSYKSDKIQTGSFGSYMNVHLINDGPVTIVLHSKTRE